MKEREWEQAVKRRDYTRRIKNLAAAQTQTDALTWFTTYVNSIEENSFKCNVALLYLSY